MAECKRMNRCSSSFVASLSTASACRQTLLLDWELVDALLYTQFVRCHHLLHVSTLCLTDPQG